MSLRQIAAVVFQEQSARTQARWARALWLDQELCRLLSVEPFYEEAARMATRPNGSLNFAKLQELMEDRAAMLIARLPE